MDKHKGQRTMENKPKTQEEVNNSLARIMGNPNTNPQTGIRYGIISGNSVSEYVLDDIYTQGDDLTFATHKQTLIEDLSAHLRTITHMQISIDYTDLFVTLCELLQNETFGQRQSIATRITQETMESLLANPTETHANELAKSIVENDFEFDCFDCESEYEYSSDGVDILLSYLGGSPILFVRQSPLIVRVKSLCSPCVPNGGDLDSGILTDKEPGGYECYGLPKDWLRSPDME